MTPSPLCLCCEVPRDGTVGARRRAIQFSPALCAGYAGIDRNAARHGVRFRQRWPAAAGGACGECTRARDEARGPLGMEALRASGVALRRITRAFTTGRTGGCRPPLTKAEPVAREGAPSNFAPRSARGSVCARQCGREGGRSNDRVVAAAFAAAIPAASANPAHSAGLAWTARLRAPRCHGRRFGRLSQQRHRGRRGGRRLRRA
jgi:hypothetical protein